MTAINALTWQGLEFQTPDRGVSLARSGSTYTLKRNLGLGRTWEVDLSQPGGQPGGTVTHSLAGSRITDGVTPTTLLNQASAWERAVTLSPHGGTPTFVGTSTHGYENETSLVMAVDGSAVALADGGSQSGSTVDVTLLSQLLHPDLGSTPIGTGTSYYTMSYFGLVHEWFIQFLRDLDSGQCYGAMMPANQSLSRGLVFSKTVVNLSADDDSMASSGKVNSACLWEPAGHHGICMHLLDDDGVAAWGFSDAKDLWIQDRTGGLLNKLYAGFSNRPIVAGDVWHGKTLYLADYFDGGADATLNR